MIKINAVITSATLTSVFELLVIIFKRHFQEVNITDCDTVLFFHSVNKVKVLKIVTQKIEELILLKSFVKSINVSGAMVEK